MVVVVVVMVVVVVVVVVVVMVVVGGGGGGGAMVVHAYVLHPGLEGGRYIPSLGTTYTHLRLSRDAADRARRELAALLTCMC